MKNWTYQNKEILSISDMQTFEPKVWGFVYHLTLINKKTKNVDFYYIGKKNIYNKRKRNFGKKEISVIKDKRKKTYEYVIRESDWKNYTSSNKFIKENLNKYDIIREIICFSTNDSDLTYKEAKEIICQNALDSSDYLNEGVKITRYNKWTQN